MPEVQILPRTYRSDMPEGVGDIIWPRLNYISPRTDPEEWFKHALILNSKDNIFDQDGLDNLELIKMYLRGKIFSRIQMLEVSRQMWLDEYDSINSLGTDEEKLDRLIWLIENAEGDLETWIEKNRPGRSIQLYRTSFEPHASYLIELQSRDDIERHIPLDIPTMEKITERIIESTLRERKQALRASLEEVDDEGGMISLRPADPAASSASSASIANRQLSRPRIVSQGTPAAFRHGLFNIIRSNPLTAPFLRSDSDIYNICSDIHRRFSGSNFGGVIEPYSPYLGKVSKKGVWLDTNFGRKKLKDDKKGLFVKANGRKYYLHLWSSK